MKKFSRVHFFDKEIKNIYKESFKKKERMPFMLMLFLSIFPTTKLIKYKVNDRSVGFIYYAVGISNIFLMFFAIKSSERNKGYGSDILNYITNKYKNKCIVTAIGDISSGDKDNVIKRKYFYSKNGFHENNYIIRMRKMNEIMMIANREFSVVRFRIFLILYSLFTLYPKIKKYN